jgi:hypothetical protein
MVELALPPDTNVLDDQVETTIGPSVPRRTAIVAIAVSVAAFVVFFLSPVRMETDSYWVVFTARSLVAHGDVNLDEYHEIVEHGTGFQVERYQGHTYYEASLATSLAAVPFVAVASLLDGRGLDHRLAEGHALPLDGVIAAVIAALATALMFVVLSGLTTRRWIALLSTAAFAFGTQVWSTASRTTWMHTPSLLCLAVALLLAQRVARNGKGVLALGAVLGLAYFVRPTNVVPLVIFGIWIAFHGRHALLRYASGAGSVFATFFVVNYAFYGRALQPYFRGSRLGLSPKIVEALVGNLVSPSRGLFVFVPVALVAGYGFIVKRRDGDLRSLDLAVAASAVGYWLVVSTVPEWWAGWAYGPRWLTDIAPFVVWFLPPVLARIVDHRRVLLGAAVATALVLSIAIQARGSLAPSSVEWNWHPTDIGFDQARLWDWSDPQFLR